MQLAGPQARFAWWGGSADSSALLTAYAYYADWHASNALGITPPREQWQPMLEIYAEQAGEMPLLHRALVLAFAQEMGLPVNTLLKGLDAAFLEEEPADDTRVADNADSLILYAPDTEMANAVARVLTDRLLKQAQIPSIDTQLARDAALALLRESQQPLAAALALLKSEGGALEATTVLRNLTSAQSSMDRALAMNWLVRDIATPPQNAPLQPGAGWVKQRSASGGEYWQWEGEGVPAGITLPEDVPGPQEVALSWRTTESGAQQSSSAPVNITHRLLKLIPGEEPFTFSTEEVRQGNLSSDALYLDEIELSGGEKQAIRYGMVDVPLPPGADVESTTWGINIQRPGKEKGTLQLEKARNETGELSYMIPVDRLEGTVIIRHLLRFSQKGTFTLPAVRYQRAYAPAQQSVEQTPALQTVTVN